MSGEKAVADSVEERLQDLEQLVMRQSERIEALEARLEAASQIARQQAVRLFKTPKTDAA